MLMRELNSVVILLELQHRKVGTASVMRTVCSCMHTFMGDRHTAACEIDVPHVSG